MNDTDWRGFRFSHPVLGVTEASGGVFESGQDRQGLSVGPTGRLTTVAGASAVKQALFLLLSTRPGERVMRPGYGCNLHRLLFEPNDATTAGLAVHHVRTAIESWEPRVELLRVDAGASDLDPALLEIAVEYKLKSTQREDWLAFGISLLAEGG